MEKQTTGGMKKDRGGRKKDGVFSLVERRMIGGLKIEAG